MLQIFTSPEIQDKYKDNAGYLNFGLQISNNYKPLSFQVAGNNAAITSFKAISIDINGIELEQISLDTAIIQIDSVNNLYYVDGSTSFSDIFCDGFYYFIFLNGLNEFKSEIFEIKQEDEFLTCDNNYGTCDNNDYTCDTTKITI